MEVFWLGDSFSNVAYNGPCLLEHFEDETGWQTGFGRMKGGRAHPGCWLDELDVSPERLRLVVLEAAERTLVNRFAAPDFNAQRQPSAAWKARLRALRTELFLNNDQQLRYLLSRSHLGRWYSRAVDTLRYRLLGEVCDPKAVFSADPPMLFYRPTFGAGPGSFFARHDDETVSRIADNLAALDRELQAQRGVRLLFVPVPNKITIYSHLVTDVPYDDFLPRLHAALQKRGVPSVDLYTPFSQSALEEDLLYLRGDTHWTGATAGEAASRIAREAKELVSEER